jgi:hypothetical protein
VSFAQPLLDLICEYTGMKASLFVGGPEPADGGRINIIKWVVISPIPSILTLLHSMHSGTSAGAIKATFGESERTAIKQVVVPLFSRFLKECYCTFASLFGFIKG